MAASAIKNPSVEICAMPAPFQGVLKGGQSIILSFTPAQLATMCPSLDDAFVVTDLDNYAGATDDADFGPITDEATTFEAPVTIAPAAVTSVGQVALTVTGAADTGITASTERSDVYINLARTVTWAAGAGPLAAQRAIRIAAPTYAGNAGTPLTITSASTFEIDNAPQAGGGITLTHPWAFRVAAGASNFVGDVWMSSMLSVTGSIWASIIADTSGNAVLACPGAPSAVNYITVTNAATGNAVELSASGDDAAVSADFAPKGTGNLTLRSGGGTARIAINNTGIGFNAAAPTAQSGAIPDAAGGATVDAEARAALNTLLAYLRLRGDIAT